MWLMRWRCYTPGALMFPRASNQKPERKIQKKFGRSSVLFVRQRGSYRKMATATVSKGNKLTKASANGRFGVYGGRYVPETLMAALEELEREYEKAKRDRE